MRTRVTIRLDSDETEYEYDATALMHRGGEGDPYPVTNRHVRIQDANDWQAPQIVVDSAVEARLLAWHLEQAAELLDAYDREHGLLEEPVF